MNFELIVLCEEHKHQFKIDMQISFQQGAVDEFGETEGEILPESHIDYSLSAEGSVAYEALIDGKSVGGAVVVIDSKTQHNRLDFLYVKVDVQSKGVGKAIWQGIEELYPKTKVWETYTPYFEKRNIHFYVNCCGFHIVKYFNAHHKYQHEAEQEDSVPDHEYFDGMFRFEKVMK